jgi:hypothetical protein
MVMAGGQVLSYQAGKSRSIHRYYLQPGKETAARRR